MAVHLRDATAADLPVVAELIRALAEYEHLEDEVLWTEEELAASLFGPGAVPRVVLAEPDDAPGVVAGLAIWFPTYSTFRGRPGIWLEDLFVRPEHRGQGVGRALLDHLPLAPSGPGGAGIPQHHGLKNSPRKVSAFQGLRPQAIRCPRAMASHWVIRP
ncbi:MAG: GNAT family N-acetyltransferase [Acidimicrobiia bacterium]